MIISDSTADLHDVGSRHPTPSERRRDAAAAFLLSVRAAPDGQIDADSPAVGDAADVQLARRSAVRAAPAPPGADSGSVDAGDGGGGHRRDSAPASAAERSPLDDRRTRRAVLPHRLERAQPSAQGREPAWRPGAGAHAASLRAARARGALRSCPGAGVRAAAGHLLLRCAHGGSRRLRRQLRARRSGRRSVGAQHRRLRPVSHGGGAGARRDGELREPGQRFPGAALHRARILRHSEGHLHRPRTAGLRRDRQAQGHHDGQVLPVRHRPCAASARARRLGTGNAGVRQRLRELRLSGNQGVLRLPPAANAALLALQIRL